MKIIPEITVLKHQLEFAHSREKNVAIVGGFGSGKSQGVVFRALDRLKQRDNALFVVIAPTNTLIEDVNLPDFEQIFSHYCIPYRRTGGSGNRKMFIDSGVFKGEVWFRSGDRPEKIVGFDATDINIDEFDVLKVPHQKILWRNCLARLRATKDSTISVSTTPEGYRETYRKFQKERIGPIIRARTTDNIYLPQDYIDELYRQFDEMLVKQYIDAQFVNINGLMAYYSFDRDRCHKKVVDPLAYPWIGIGWDFNVAKMCCELFVCDVHRREMHFFDEIIIKGAFGTESPTERAARIIKEKYPDKELRAFPDSTGRSKSTNATESDLEIIRRAGIKVYARKSNPFVRDRLNAVNSKFSDGTLTVDTEKCPDLTEDLEQCMRDQYGDLDKSDEERTHSSDAAGYPTAYLFPVRKPAQIVKRAS